MVKIKYKIIKNICRTNSIVLKYLIAVLQLLALCNFIKEPAMRADRLSLTFGKIPTNYMCNRFMNFTWNGRSTAAKLYAGHLVARWICRDVDRETEFIQCSNRFFLLIKGAGVKLLGLTEIYSSYTL